MAVEIYSLAVTTWLLRLMSSQFGISIVRNTGWLRILPHAPTIEIDALSCAARGTEGLSEDRKLN